jgi:hypothetical protein
MAYVTPRTWVASQLVTAAELNQDVRDNVGYVYGRAQCFVWTISGGLTVGADKGFHFAVYGDVRFVEAEVLVKTAPTGASLIVDINLDGVSLWATHPANRPTIAAAGKAGETTSFDTATATDDQVLTVDVDQVGSGTAGSDLTVVLWYV